MFTNENRNNQEIPPSHLSMYQHLDPWNPPRLLVLQMNCPHSHQFPTPPLRQQVFPTHIWGLVPQNLSSCFPINYFFPNTALPTPSHQTCYYFSQLKNQTRLNIMINSPCSSFQSIACPTLEQSSFKEVFGSFSLQILSPLPVLNYF